MSESDRNNLNELKPESYSSGDLKPETYIPGDEDQNPDALEPETYGDIITNQYAENPPEEETESGDQIVSGEPEDPVRTLFPGTGNRYLISPVWFVTFNSWYVKSYRTFYPFCSTGCNFCSSVYIHVCSTTPERIY